MPAGGEQLETRLWANGSDNAGNGIVAWPPSPFAYRRLGWSLEYSVLGWIFSVTTTFLENAWNFPVFSSGKEILLNTLVKRPKSFI